MAKQIDTIIITLEYLLNKTDENHKAKPIEIDRYAQENYGLSIDHRCIKTFLDRFKEFCDDNPDKFPFILESNGGERPKYYLEQKYFSKEEIISIASAIKDSFQIDSNTSEQLINSFINVTTSEHEEKEILNIVNSQPEKSDKIKKSTLKILHDIEGAIKNKSEITYVDKKDPEQIEHTDYAYKIYYFENEPVVVIIRDGSLISIFIKDIRLIRVEETWYSDPRCRFQIKDKYNGEFDSVDEEIDKKIIPAPSSLCSGLCSFTFENNNYVIETIKRSFEACFHKRFVCYFSGNRCYSSIEQLKIEAFIRWATKYDVANLITVVGDKNTLFALEKHYKEMINKNNLDKYEFNWTNKNGKSNK